MISRLIHHLTSHKMAFPVLALFLVIIMALVSREPVIDNTLSGYNLDENPYQATGERMMEIFGSGNIIQVIVEPEMVKAQELFSGLETVEKLLTEAFPGIRAESLHKASRLLRLETGEEASVKEMLTVATGMPVLSNLVGKDTLSFLLVAFLENPQKFSPEIFDRLTDRKYPGIKSMQSISPFHIREEMGKAIVRDYRVLLPVILFLVVVYLFYAFGSFRAVLYCLAHVGIALLTVSFFYTVTGIKVNQITSTALPVVMILSLSASIHLLTGYVHQPGSLSKIDRIRESMRLYVVPSFLTVFTTAIAFASFVFSGSRYIRQFGLITALSVLAVFLLTYLAAPLFLRIAGNKGYSMKRQTFSVLFEKKIVRYNKIISIILISLLVVSLFLLPQLTFQTNLETFLPRGSRVYTTNQQIKKNFHSLAEIDLLVEANPEIQVAVNKSELLALVRDFSSRITTYPEVSAVQSVSDQMEFERLHSFPGIRLILFPRIHNPYVSGDQSKYRINVKLKEPEDIWTVRNRIASDFYQYGENYHFEMYSDFLLFHFINASITDSLMKSLILSASLILLILFMLTRNLRITAVTMLANLIPLGLLAAILALFRIEISVAVSMTLVISLGIIVDDTIHILYRRVYLSRPLGELGFGVVTTSIILSAGFFSFILSRSLPNQTFGMLCSMAFIIAIVSDLSVMSWLIREKNIHH